MFQIFKKLGGQDAALAEVRRMTGRRACWPAPTTLALWRENKQPPGKVILHLMQIAEQRGVRYRAKDFILVPDPPAKKGRRRG